MRRASMLPMRWHLGIGCAAALATMIVPSEGLRSALFVLACLQLGIAVAWAVKIHHIHRGVFLATLLTAGCFGATYFVSAFGESTTIKLIAGSFQLLGSVFLIVGVASIVRRRRGAALGVIGDGLIVGLGSWVITWAGIVKPMLDLHIHSVPVTILSGVYQPAGSVQLFLIAVLLFTATERPAALRLLSTGLILNLVGDLIYALQAAGHIGTTPLRVADGLYVATLFFAGAAFSHPTVVTFTQRQSVDGERRLLGRLIITTTSLIIPVMVLAALSPRDGVDQVVRIVSAFVLAGAVTLRVVQSVRANTQAQQELLHAAQTDALTGLPNRSLLLERLHECIEDSFFTNRHPTVFFIDIDRFKNINDSLGHVVGDDVLRTVSVRLENAMPSRAMVARLSADEFVVLDPDSKSPGAAMALAERLLAVFREPLALAQGDVFVTASVGLASSSASSVTTADDLLRHADTAMYRAKDAGRNCVAVYDESMHERVAHRLAVETALYRALDRRELRLFHQPILDMVSGEVVGFEALMRWQQSDGTIVSPAEFIPIAEDTGTIVPIGSWAILEALTQLRTWIDDGVCSATATMSVNVSPRQLSDPNFPAVVNEALGRSGVPPQLLWLEVTESVMISEPELALATLRRLRSLGVRIALDDFGTGYSSLSLLQQFPIQRIKIDRAFVQGVAENPNDRSLVRTIVAMGRSLGLDMVAEGVESVHQLQVLHDLGCTKAQGYLISHPVPADAMRSTVSALERLGTFPGLRGATDRTTTN